MQQICLPSIWSASPCTMPYSNRAPSFDKTKRFEFNSIYYKDDPFKPKHQQNPLSRPEMVLHQFRKKIKEATKSYQTTGYLIKKKKSDLEENQLKTINIKATEVTGRLYEQPNQVLPLKYDLNGNRSSFFEDENKNQKENHKNNRSISPRQISLSKLQHKSCENVYITSTLRTDFGRPLNFHPGPGSYYITQNQPDSLLRSKLSGKSMQSSFDGKSSCMSKSVHEDKSPKQRKDIKNILEGISKKYSTIDDDHSQQSGRGNHFLKRVQNVNTAKKLF